MNAIKYYVAHAIFSIVYISLFTINFGYDFEVILIHFCVLIIANTLLLSLFWLISKVVKINQNQELIIKMTFTVYWFILLFLYAINWVSNYFWGGNILSGFFIQLPKHIDSIGRLYEVSIWVFYSIFILILIGIWKLVSHWKYTNMVNSIKLKRSLLGLSIVSSFYLLLVYNSNHLAGKWGFEPILSSFSKENATYNSVRSSEQRIKDHIIRMKMLEDSPEHSPNTNVIVIMADALRADHMPIYGYERVTTPFIDSIQESLQKVDLFTSTCSESVCGILSALASREFYDIGFGLYDVSDVLKDIGYHKYFLLSANHHWNNLEKLYGDNHDVYLDGNSRFPEMSMYDDEAVILNLKELPSYSDKPAFFYFHLVSTHEIGVINPQNAVYTPSKRETSKYASFNEIEISQEEKQALINGYDNGVLQLDNYIEEIFESLDQKGYLNDAIVIITSDHGEGIGERGLFYHTYHLYQEDISIPLLVYDTSTKCKLKNTRYGTHIDIAPTILDCLGLPEIETWQGVSLLKKSPEIRYTFHQTLRNRGEFALIRETEKNMYKMMVSRVRGELSNFRLFDVYADPKEQFNLFEKVDDQLITEMIEIIEKKIKNS